MWDSSKPAYNEFFKTLNERESMSIAERVTIIQLLLYLVTNDAYNESNLENDEEAGDLSEEELKETNANSLEDVSQVKEPE